MSCGCGPSYYSGYDGPCWAELPYPQVSHESVPSLIDNLVAALYGGFYDPATGANSGGVVKSVVNDRVVWQTPCNPSMTNYVPGIPPNPGEGMLCYIMRVFQNYTGSGSGIFSPFYNWTFTGNGSTTTYPLPDANVLLSAAYLVYVDGVVQAPTNYTIVNGSPLSIVFSTAIPNGSQVVIVSISTASTGALSNVTLGGNTTYGTLTGGDITSTGIVSGKVVASGSTTPRTLSNRFADVVNVLDFGADPTGTTNSSTAFLEAATQSVSTMNQNTVTAPNGNYIANVPAINGKNVLYFYPNGPDSDLVINGTGTRGGIYSDWDNKSGSVSIFQINENQSSVPTGGFRDASYIQTVDTDTTNYTTIFQKVTNGLRVFNQGANNGTSYISQYKDLVGAYFASYGNIQWDARGVSGINADALQFGIGVCTNEFSVQNLSSANGGVGQSKSMAAVQGIVKSQYANEDSTHQAVGFLCTNIGNRITSAFQADSISMGPFTSNYKYGLQLGSAVVSGAGIVMPSSASGDNGTVILYDSNSYSLYYRSQGVYAWVINGSAVANINSKGISVGGNSALNTRIYIAPSNATASHIFFDAGVAPTSPNNGDLWFDGTALKIRISGVTKTITVS